MAASFTFSTFYSKLLSLALLSMLVGSSWAGRRANLRAVCSKTNNSVLCMRLLYPNTRNSDGDTRGIANAAINLVYNKVSEICSKDAMSDLEQSRGLLGDGPDGDYGQLTVQMNHAAERARRCAESWQGDYDSVKRINGINDQVEVLRRAVRVCVEMLSRDDDDNSWILNGN